MAQNNAKSIPKLPQFNPEEISFDLYMSLVEASFTTYGIEDDVMKKNLLIVNMGVKSFFMLASLTSPDNPSDKTYAEIVSCLKRHYITKPSYHRSLVLFQQRRKRDLESLKDLFADLKKLAKDCRFGSNFDHRLRDQLFMAVDSLPYFKFLLAEDLNLDELTADKLLDRLQTLEKAHMGENVPTSVENPVNKIQRQKVPSSSNSSAPVSSRSSSCKHCGYPHESVACRFKNLSCNNCGIKGHLQAVCRKSKKLDTTSRTKPTYNSNKIKVVDEEEEDFLYNVEEIDLNINKIKPEIYRFNINGVEIPLEVDSGACVSLLSDDMCPQGHRKLTFK